MGIFYVVGVDASDRSLLDTDDSVVKSWSGKCVAFITAPIMAVVTADDDTGVDDIQCAFLYVGVGWVSCGSDGSG